MNADKNLSDSNLERRASLVITSAAMNALAPVRERGSRYLAALRMTILLSCALFVPLLLHAGQNAASDLDLYGGCRDLKAPGGATGYFRLARAGSRWVFTTPEGNAFWLRSVYGVSLYDGGEMLERSVKWKYRSPSVPWEPYVAHAVQRLRGWGFNALGEYTSEYALPLGTYGRPNGNSERMPFIRLIRPSRYSITSGQVKSIIAGLDATIYTGWRGGQFPDVFAPAYAAFAQALARDAVDAPVFTTPPDNSPWLVGTSVDDADELYGFGPEPDLMPDHYHFHLGWAAAVTAPMQLTNPDNHRPYADTRVYTKYAFRDFLREKYKTIAALNAVWNARYTTWDSDGGWPLGKGVLDESGRGPWMGKDCDQLTDVSAQVRADLDDFLERLADRYFATVAEAVRASSPHHMVFGPAAIAAASRPQILRAAGRHLDVVQVWAPPNRLELLQRAYALSGKPLFVWTTFNAQPDSPLVGNSGWEGGYDLPTQEARGQAYAAYLHSLLSLHAAADGMYPMLGIDWWAWTDKVVGGENTDFGLVDYHDNAYDGKEDRRAASQDAFGLPTGGEIRDYGNFLGMVTQANQNVCNTLRQEWNAGKPGGK
jgi:hypothetical protein